MDNCNNHPRTLDWFRWFIDSGHMARLRDAEVRTMHCLLRHYNPSSREAYPSVDRIAAMIGRSPSTVRAALTSLQTAGLISCDDHARTGGKGRSTRWRLCDIPNPPVGQRVSDVDTRQSRRDTRQSADQTRQSDSSNPPDSRWGRPLEEELKTSKKGQGGSASQPEGEEDTLDVPALSEQLLRHCRTVAHYGNLKASPEWVAKQVADIDHARTCATLALYFERHAEKEKVNHLPGLVASFVKDAAKAAARLDQLRQRHPQRLAEFEESDDEFDDEAKLTALSADYVETWDVHEDKWDGLQFINAAKSDTGKPYTAKELRQHAKKHGLTIRDAAGGVIANLTKAHKAGRLKRRDKIELSN